MRDLYAAATGPHAERYAASRNASLRYWAARRGEAPNLLATLLNDKSPAVRIAAARRLPSIDVLAKELAHPEPTVRLMAVNALDELGEAARPALPTLQHALQDPDNYVVRVANHAVNTLLGTRHEVK